MTPEAQRIAIARAMGIKQIIMFQGEPWYSLRGDGKANLPIPDYLNDLNAMHEAEKTLNDPNDYGYHLINICNRDKTLIIHPTAAQRCEAFLKTIGEWVEEPASEKESK